MVPINVPPALALPQVRAETTEQLKFGVLKVPKLWISVKQEIRVQVTSYQGIRKNEPDVLIT